MMNITGGAHLAKRYQTAAEQNSGPHQRGRRIKSENNDG